MLKTKAQIQKMYRDWRKANGNKKPNRVVVRVIWQDDYDKGDETTHVGTLGIEDMNALKFVDNPAILWYIRTLESLWKLRNTDNGSDFIVVDVLEFYKAKK